MSGVAIIGQFRLPADRIEEARPMMRAVIEATRAEAGCLLYCLAEDVLDPGLIRVSERWESREAVGAHLKTDHMRIWGEQRAAIGANGRHIVLYQIAGEEEV